MTNFSMNKAMSYWGILVSTTAATLALSACGGGGGGGGGSTPSATPVAVGPQLSIGTIGGFGSVIVNGIRFDDSKSSVSFDDSEDAVGTDNRGMQLGMNVEVKGNISDDRLSGVASEIHVESLVRGPVTAVTAAATGNGGTMEAMGAKVVADDNTKFFNIAKAADIKVGDIINVHGVLNADGSVQAKFLEKRASVNEYKTIGKVASNDKTASKFKLGALTVTYDSTTQLRKLPNGVSDGLLVRVRGASSSFDASANSLKASRIKAVTPFDDNGVNEGEIKGPVADLSADKSSFTINGVKVAVSSSTVYKDGTAANLVNGAIVEAEGAFANGVLQAKKVEFRGANSDDDSGELHGTISDLASTTSPSGFSFTVHGQKVQTDGATVFKLRSASALSNGMKVEVRGGSLVNGVLTATKVSEEDH